ncbi:MULTISPECIES: UbiH/UbiF family hydroxylase [Halocynthiibacter]|uniref:UbiH/UbiF family hydroxylase n=1 Tax=Halocynthiibacter halioticoli TaxID=2986804 RepID=A0AAE3J291_9RHOB|nr:MULTISPECIES: UbiH/UbiF family hydroxylase [Halocynthiibacter]MCV6823877.1 UbiH/UbiF family hydroxylase [Halocynthiibacter halioticoli]MCW4056878.1 UbiH/UbiF family hydroxylase [Halocynthiibacter sp. SDUM655004]
MSRHSTDILISGGGIAGLTAAASFGAAGFSVVCVDPAPPVTEQADPKSDLRTTAFLQPARQTLMDAGLWERLADYAAPLQIMRIVDAGGETPEPRIIKDFDAAEISDLPFGWNLPNWLLRREILAQLETMPNVTFRAGVATQNIVTREAEALVSLSDGSRYTTQLLIGADGRNSHVRRAHGIDVKTMRYGQKALAFSVEHHLEHHNISTEVHRSGGPFTLVPLPSREGRHFSAVVWKNEGPEIERLAALSEAEFEEEMSARSAHILGPLKLATRRSKWPIISQIAHRMTAQRTALMAEAAHVVPPIGAQGLNMSLGDLRVLRELAVQNPAQIGSTQMLDTYESKRMREAKIRVSGVDLLNRASMLGAQGLRDLRAEALTGLYAFTPLRKGLMRAGLGAR